MKEEKNSCHKIDKLREHTHHALRQGARHVYCSLRNRHLVEETCPFVHRKGNIIVSAPRETTVLL